MLGIHKDVPLHCWKIVTLCDGYQTICHNHGGGDDIYDVPIWELADPQGLARWMSHLRRKNWFQQTENQFWHAMREAEGSSIVGSNDSPDEQP
jgi:hypothetical protein